VRLVLLWLLLTPQFRFSPRPNRAAEIRWRAWDAPAFDEARHAHKPILLSLSAIWCHWCHVLDETTLSDASVIALANGDFVPIRVDADQHPDVERRYILGGWPTVAMLTPDGEIIDGGTYVPPDSFLRMATQARDAFKAGGAALESKLAQHRGRFDPTRPGALDGGIVEGVARALSSAADLQHGGFGGAPKFPSGDAVVFLFDVGETELAQRALDGMLRLEDPVEGGFFRYATRADWTVPHYEKMLSGNAELLEACARAFVATRNPKYRATAQRTFKWLERTLWKSSELAASQDADEKYYALDAAARAKLQAPYIDRTYLTDRAARMIHALAVAGRALKEPPMHELARTAAKTLLGMQEPDGRFLHARAPSPVRGQLGDQAWAALALYELGGEFVAPAKKCLDATLRTLASPDGNLYDADAGALGLTAHRERPIEENAVFARALLAAGRKADAERVLRAYAGSYMMQGIHAAGYGRAVHQLLP
jgi:uncharacterized protein YyaL (SSP411 family)